MHFGQHGSVNFKQFDNTRNDAMLLHIAQTPRLKKRTTLLHAFALSPSHLNLATPSEETNNRIVLNAVSLSNGEFGRMRCFLGSIHPIVTLLAFDSSTLQFSGSTALRLGITEFAGFAGASLQDRRLCHELMA